MAKEKGRATKGGDLAAFTVVAKKTMMRGGRAWTAGVHVFDTAEKLSALGTPEEIAAMIATLELYPDDFVVQLAEATSAPSSEQSQT